MADGLAGSMTDRGPPWSVWLIAGAILAAVAAGAAASLDHADRLFVRFNRERVEAVAARAAQTPDIPVVVALGASRLRHATHDEAEMAGLAAARGQPGLHFLRIVHNSGAFADFEPLLDDLLALRPALVLLEIDLLFKERRTLPFLHIHLRDLMDVALRGHPLRGERDEWDQQYGKPCDRRDEAGWDHDPGRLDRFERNVGREMRFDAGLPAYDRVRRFVERARAAGTRVVILHLRSRPVWEARLHGPGHDYRPDALARVAQDPAMVLWRYPAALQEAGRYCDYVHLTPEGRDAYSAWLADRIAAFPPLPRGGV